jgi:hypothetical protein
MHAGLGPASIIHASFFSQIYLGLHCRQSKWVHGLHTNWNQGERRSHMSQRIQDWWNPCGMSQGKGWVGLTVCWWCQRKAGNLEYIYIILYIIYITYIAYIYISISIYRYIYRYTNIEMRSPSLVITILQRFFSSISQWDWQTPGWSQWTSHGVSDWNYIGKTFVPYIYMQYIYIYAIYIYTYIYPSEVSNFESKTANIYTYIYIYNR